MPPTRRVRLLPMPILQRSNWRNCCLRRTHSVQPAGWSSWSRASTPDILHSPVGLSESHKVEDATGSAEQRMRPLSSRTVAQRATVDLGTPLAMSPRCSFRPRRLAAQSWSKMSQAGSAKRPSPNTSARARRTRRTSSTSRSARSAISSFTELPICARKTPARMNLAGPDYATGVEIISSARR